MTSEPEIYDLVLKGGRVVDPAQEIDGVADVAIRNDRVAAVARSRRTSISASSRKRPARAGRS